jgi:alkanesulfonate monooxygenase SsuD/methylene tetrahydromethanopterin reductase-like flavin-dependent oxidoreductase (luciferase family)
VVAIRFGLALDFGTRRTTLDHVVAEYVPLIRLAERYGFESVWAGESYPTAPGGFHLPSPLLVLAALAPQTSVRLGTGVTLVPMWHPLRLAYDSAVLDQIAGGRFVLGVGLGNPGDWRRFGVDRDTIADRMDETLRMLRALWAGEQGYHGQLLSTERGIGPLPTRAGGPPLWVGGAAPRSARRAAQFGDAWYSSTNYTFATIAQQAERYRKALAATGKDPAAAVVSINRLAFVAPTDEQARSEGGQYVERVLERYASVGALRAPEGEERNAPHPLLAAAAADLCLVGSPESVSARLADYAAAGVTHVQMRVAPGDMPSELIARSITLAGEQILPRFNA